MSRTIAWALIVGAGVVPSGCGGERSRAADAAMFDPVAPLGPLPPPASVASTLFSTSDRCAQCHLADDGDALRDAAGRDVSPVFQWRSSLMALSGRDPYWLAAFSHELAERPGATDVIESACTRCHAPAASVELGLDGDHLGLADIAQSTSDAAHLGRDGVTCSACHQIEDRGLGIPASFTGGFAVGTERRIYGPHADPFPRPMEHMVGYTPVQADHMTSSALCATCHTVITRALDAAGTPVGPEVSEQVPYLEWRNSSFSDEGTPGPRAASCQTCHMPTTDEDGAPISTRIATMPPWLAPRTPVARHGFVGGNSYVLELMADHADWTGSDVPPDEIRASAAANLAGARQAARVAITSVARDGAALSLTVRVTNDAGHKFPTAYPTRRAWLHLRVRGADGAARFESGGHDDRGAIVDGAGQRLDGAGALVPHRDVITAADQVQIYEAVPVDAAGAPTHVLTSAVGFAKDNRVLPDGWSATHPDAARTMPIGTDGDATFRPGLDDVTYQIADAGTGPLSIEVELLFQTVTPAAVAGLAEVETGAARRFVGMAAARPPRPVRIARDGREL